MEHKANSKVTRMKREERLTVNLRALSVSFLPLRIITSLWDGVCWITLVLKRVFKIHSCIGLREICNFQQKRWNVWGWLDTVLLHTKPKQKLNNFKNNKTWKTTQISQQIKGSCCSSFTFSIQLQENKCFLFQFSVSISSLLITVLNEKVLEL